MGKVIYKKEDLPKKARYKLDKDRLYISEHFEDREIITLKYYCTKPSGTGAGNAWYTNGKIVCLVNIRELEGVVE